MPCISVTRGRSQRGLGEGGRLPPRANKIEKKILKIFKNQEEKGGNWEEKGTILKLAPVDG